MGEERGGRGMERGRMDGSGVGVGVRWREVRGGVWIGIGGMEWRGVEGGV